MSLISRLATAIYLKLEPALAKAIKDESAAIIKVIREENTELMKEFDDLKAGVADLVVAQTAFNAEQIKVLGDVQAELSRLGGQATVDPADVVAVAQTVAGVKVAVDGNTKALADFDATIQAVQPPAPVPAPGPAPVPNAPTS